MGTLEPVWLVCEGRVLASAMRATTRRDRRRGLIGVDEIRDAFVLEPCRWIHTFGMKVDIDVAYLDHEGRVLRTEHVKRNRVSALQFRAHSVVEAASGSLQRWNLRVGDMIEVRTSDGVQHGQ